MIENTVDATTGMVTVRATMPNADELLWPGTLVTAQLTLRIEEAVTVPSPAVQVSQTGTFVFVVKDNGSRQCPPGQSVARTLDDEIGHREAAWRAARPSSPTASCCSPTAPGWRRARPKAGS